MQAALFLIVFASVAGLGLWRRWSAVLTFGGAFLAACVALAVAVSPGKKPTSSNDLTEGDALYLCAQAYRRLARDPDNVVVPTVPDHGSGTESYFAWGASTKTMRMRNGLGLDVATSGSCIVDRRARLITALTLDGKTLIGP